MSTTPEVERLQKADDNLDRLQAKLDRLDALENLDGRNRDDAERERLNHAIYDAVREREDAEIDQYRAEGDDAMVAKHESDRMHRDLIAAEAAQAIVDDLRRQHDDDDAED